MIFIEKIFSPLNIDYLCSVYFVYCTENKDKFVLKKFLKQYERHQQYDIDQEIEKFLDSTASELPKHRYARVFINDQDMELFFKLSFV